MKHYLKRTLFFTALLLVCGGCARSSFHASDTITVLSREDGSGTRGAFIEIFGIEVKGEDGSKTDTTTKEAVIVNQTGVMMANVTADPSAIGYLSLGSLNSTVKAVSINNAEATAENVKNGTYPVVRPFYVATADEPSALCADFLAFLLSAEGQAVVSENYIPVQDGASPFVGTLPSGRIVIAGSSSVTPVMEKLKEAYLLLNPNAAIEIQQNDSSTGLSSAMAGTCDLAMASRELKESELAKLTPVQIASDGIAVIVNPENPLKQLTTEQVKDIFTGVSTKWSEFVQ